MRQWQIFFPVRWQKARIRIRIRIRRYLCLKSVSSTSSPSLTSWFHSRLRPSREKIPPENREKKHVFKKKTVKSASNSLFQSEQLFSEVRRSSIGRPEFDSRLGAPWRFFSSWAKKLWGYMYKKTDLGEWWRMNEIVLCEWLLKIININKSGIMSPNL